jgi:hypothetical protein
MNHSEMCKLRLANQQLLGSNFKTATEMVGWFGAVQGQEYAYTKWGLGLRLPHLNDADIEQELEEGRLLRTHILRPTWHLLAAGDIRWMMMLSAPRVHQVNGFMYRQTGMDRALLRRCTDLIAKALEGHRHLTRHELQATLAQAGIQAEGPRLAYAVMYAELEAIICNGPRRGKQHTYALIDERVPAAPAKTREEALAELTRRYFLSRGPATAKDFSTWSGLTVADCKKGIDLFRPELYSEKMEGNEYFYFKNRPALGVEPSGALHLLPIYDEYIMGYKDRSAYLKLTENIEPKPNFAFFNTIVLDGQIVGTWKRVFQNKSIEFEYEFFQPLAQEQQLLFNQSVERFGRFHKLPVNYEQSF